MLITPLVSYCVLFILRVARLNLNAQIFVYDFCIKTAQLRQLANFNCAVRKVNFHFPQDYSLSLISEFVASHNRTEPRNSRDPAS